MWFETKTKTKKQIPLLVGRIQIFFQLAMMIDITELYILNDLGSD